MGLLSQLNHVLLLLRQGGKAGKQGVLRNGLGQSLFKITGLSRLPCGGLRDYKQLCSVASERTYQGFVTWLESLRSHLCQARAEILTLAVRVLWLVRGTACLECGIVCVPREGWGYRAGDTLAFSLSGELSCQVEKQRDGDKRKGGNRGGSG